MSIRTIIEINHDFLTNLRLDPERTMRLFDALKGPRPEEEFPQGVRLLAQRHHTEHLSLEVD